MGIAAIVPAAGRGERLGGGTPKALQLLCGEPVLHRAVAALTGYVELIVVVAPADHLDIVAGLPGAIRVVPGGATRRESVAAGLRALPADADIVLVHDAARPLVPGALVVAVIEAVRAGADAVVPVLPVTDTVKSVDPQGRVTATLDRAGLVAVQTPQGFRRDVLVRAHAQAGGIGTDDASLVEALGVAVLTIPGHPAAFKITTPYDVVLAELLIGAG
ncbi:2-C-methyl-D-erythritol 4-phosphate cytidylyltransferase [soil metagenome]